MRRLHLLIALLASTIASSVGLIAAMPASASSVSGIYQDCEANGQLTGHYSRAELQTALNDMPSQMAEYSDCQDIIQQALLSQSRPSAHHVTPASPGASGPSSPSKGGGGTLAKAKPHRSGKFKVRSTGRSNRGNAAAVNLAGSSIRPGSSGTSASARSLPAALLVVLVLLALTAVSGGAVAIRRRVVARDIT